MNEMRMVRKLNFDDEDGNQVNWEDEEQTTLKFT